MENLSYKELYKTLTPDQKEAIELLIKRRNVFLTGEAGTGKSYVVNVFDKYCEENGLRIAKCAPTGIAATEISGATLHHQFKLDLEPMTKTPYSYPSFLNAVDILLIDEISMCRIDIFEYIMLQVMRANNMPDRVTTCNFIQVILVGDFFQLPPVITDKDRYVLEQWYTCPIDKGYSFQSSIWKEMGFRTVNLKTIIRQQDKVFCENLSKARHGDYSCVRYIEEHSARKALAINDSICLVGKNTTASAINLNGIKLINGKEYVSKIELFGEIEKGDYPCEDEFVFKIGARVMSLLNDKNGAYNNGTLGTIIGYNEKTKAIEVEFDNGEEASIKKYSFENYEYSADKDTKINNQAKIKEFELLKSDMELKLMLETNEEKINEFKSAIDMYNKDIEMLKNGKSDLSLKKNIIGSAKQYPLKLAYAITIHKSQGQTFEKVNIVPEIFDDGQFYVAVSRCKSIENIYFAGTINPLKIKANQEVEEFYADSDNYSFFDKQFISVKVPKNKYNDLIYDLLTDEDKYNYVLKASEKYGLENDRLDKIKALKARMGK